MFFADKEQPQKHYFSSILGIMGNKGIVDVIVNTEEHDKNCMRTKKRRKKKNNDQKERG